MYVGRTSSSFRSTRGIMSAELIVGLTIFMIIAGAGVGVFRPLLRSFTKAKYLGKLQKVEQHIRREIFNQSNYASASLSTLQIKIGDVVIAENGVTRYVADDLSDSSIEAKYPIRTQLQMTSFTTSGGSTKIGAIYQVGVSENAGVNFLPLGAPEMPDLNPSSPHFKSAEDFLAENYDPQMNSDLAKSILVAPDSFVNSVKQSCPSDSFIRGLSADGVVQCWRLGNSKCPEWSIPVGLRFISTSNTYEIICQKLNRVECPDIDLALSSGGVKTLASFRALSKISYSDFYPPVSNARSGGSECKSIIDFNKYNVSGSAPGFIPSAQVLDPVNIEKISTSGVAACPSPTLYSVGIDQSCTPLFDPGVPLVVPASVSPSLEVSPDE